VGVEVVEFLDGYSDGVVGYGLGLRRDLARAVRRHRPEVLVGLTFAERFVGGGSNQADHRAVGLATLDAAKAAGNRWIFRELLDEALEPWGGVRYVCFSGAPEPTHGVDVTGYLDAGVASLRAHRRTWRGWGTPRPTPRRCSGGWRRAAAPGSEWTRRCCSTCTC
jgi:LmbE family N-acetylglucosaminyl deacetylase